MRQQQTVNSQSGIDLGSHNVEIGYRLTGRSATGGYVSGTCPAGEYYASAMYIANGGDSSHLEPHPYWLTASSVSGVTSSELVSLGMMAVFKINNATSSTCTFYVTTSTTAWPEVYANTVAFRYYQYRYSFVIDNFITFSHFSIDSPKPVML